MPTSLLRCAIRNPNPTFSCGASLALLEGDAEAGSPFLMRGLASLSQ
jgi:hypothetical protein